MANQPRQIHAEYMNGWRRRNVEKYRESSRQARRKNPESHRMSSLRHREKYPEKEKARKAISNAIRDGRIVRPDHCSKCGLICKPQAHHADYSKPLEVTWLCKICHVSADGREWLGGQ